MSSSPEQRRSKRDKKPPQRYEASSGLYQPTTAQRPLPQKPQKRAAARQKLLETGSVMEDIHAASIPVAHYESIEASYPEEFYAGDNGLVPFYEPTTEELHDPEKLIRHGVAMAEAADTAFVKMRMPSDYVKKLRDVDNYTYFYPLMLKDFWTKIPQTYNKSVLYAREVDGSLYPSNFSPFNMMCMIGFLDKAFRSQGHIPGIYTNVVYFGHARSSFLWHTEDMELLSINFHHTGAPKIWYGLAPSQKKLTYETFRNFYRLYFDKCPQEPRHKRLFTLPAMLERAGIRVVRTVQRAGDLIITRPWGWHMGFSLGLNVTEAVNAGYEDLNRALINYVHDKKLFCRCGYNTTGVILDYEFFGMDGHINSIAKLHEENANMRLRIAELERLVRGGTQPCPHDGLVPSTSTATLDFQAVEVNSDFEPLDFGVSGYDSATPTSERAHSSHSTRVKRQRVQAFTSDDESDDDRPTPMRRYKKKTVARAANTDDDDGHVPSGGAKTRKRGRNPYTTDEEDAVVSCLVYEKIYDVETSTFTAGYKNLPLRGKPTGTSFWAPYANKGHLERRNAESLRTYFANHFDPPQI